MRGGRGACLDTGPYEVGVDDPWVALPYPVSPPLRCAALCYAVLCCAVLCWHSKSKQPLRGRVKAGAATATAALHPPLSRYPEVKGGPQAGVVFRAPAGCTTALGLVWLGKMTAAKC
ncbi:hypothetical protein PLESTF_001384700 [Pleodorina starrii]|nr:hypothetical protein PLESTF_001384700 [Pleodorina starrii]